MDDINPFPNKPWFLRVCSTSLLKTLWEKEKLLVTSNFSFSHSVFYPFRELPVIFIKFEIVVWKLFQFGRVQSSSFGKGLNTYFVEKEHSKTRKHIACSLFYDIQSLLLLLTLSQTSPGFYVSGVQGF